MYEPDFTDLYSRLVNGGGFIFLPTTGECIDSGTGEDGYTVPLPECHEELAHPCGVHVLRDFYHRNRELFDEEDYAFEAYWDLGTDFLDVSALAEDQREAMKLARAWGVESVFWLKDAEYVPVVRKGTK